jgi:hypothetical protein
MLPVNTPITAITICGDFCDQFGRPCAVTRPPLDTQPEADRWIQNGDRRARLIGRSRSGGLRIDGGPDGFAERTVSLVDLAWVIEAAADVERTGGLLDESRVNKLRYLARTPEGSTRWIDTGWAIAMWRAVNRVATTAP